MTIERTLKETRDRPVSEYGSDLLLDAVWYRWMGLEQTSDKILYTLAARIERDHIQEIRNRQRRKRKNRC